VTSEPYWRRKTLDQMTLQEWESLCDGCGKCCLVKLEDEDTGKIHYTDVACALLDTGACRCTDYGNRQQRIPDCVTLTPENINRVKNWMPSSCAYRLLADGKPLPDWHHLECGDTQAVHHARKSVRGRCVTETGIEIDDLPARIVRWPR